MAKENYLGIFRKRGMIVCKIIRDGINYNKKKCQEGTLVNSKIPSTKDPHHIETSHMTWPYRVQISETKLIRKKF